MYNLDNNNIKKSIKELMMLSAIASLLMIAMITTIVNANAIELSKLSNFKGIDDTGQSVECVIVVVGCDSTGSVVSSGDVSVGRSDNNSLGGDISTTNSTRTK